MRACVCVRMYTIPYHTIPTRVLYLLVSLCDCVSGIECVRTSEAWNIDRESSVHRSSARHTVCECSHEQKQSRRATVTSQKQKQQRKIFHWETLSVSNLCVKVFAAFYSPNRACRCLYSVYVNVYGVVCIETVYTVLFCTNLNMLKVFLTVQSSKNLSKASHIDVYDNFYARFGS